MGHIALTAVQDDENLVLTLADDGRGLPVIDGENVSDKIFEVGFSTKTEANTTSGRGMGMHIVQTAIVENEGRIALFSKPKEGTSVTIHLPLQFAEGNAC